jgi:mono/diheme cytochrome c family protein
MWVQQRVEAQDSSEFYALTDPVRGFDGKIYGDGSRPIPENTIARGKLQNPNDPFITGKDAQGNLLTKLPPQVKLTREFLNKGQEKYNVFCAQCHGRAGDGKGMIALRGQWPRPVPSLVREQLLAQPIGYFFSSGKYGFGIMYGYGSRMTDEELWAVAAYVRVLQLSQNANLKDLGPEDIEKLAQAEQARRQSREADRERVQIPRSARNDSALREGDSLPAARNDNAADGKNYLSFRAERGISLTSKQGN